MSKKPVLLKCGDRVTKDGLWHGRFEGEDIGTGVTVLFFVTEELGYGSRSVHDR